MAISPDELKHNLLSEAKEFEVKIDERLLKEKLYGNQVTIIPPAGMSSAHFNLIKDQYINVGWESVEWKDSQYDGVYLSFTVK